jgi:hypothetical protein
MDARFEIFLGSHSPMGQPSGITVDPRLIARLKNAFEAKKDVPPHLVDVCHEVCARVTGEKGKEVQLASDDEDKLWVVDALERL